MLPKGSNVYQLNQWMWEFGRGKPRLGGLSVTDTEGGMRLTSVPSLPGQYVATRFQRQQWHSEVEKTSYYEKIKHGIYLCQIIVHVISYDG
jgi:hypothetical protein